MLIDVSSFVLCPVAGSGRCMPGECRSDPPSFRDSLRPINRSPIIRCMSDFDWLDLDARLLRMLVATLEAGSVTGAAQRLGVTQS
ncbi:MAG TPA: LysR family transcriptional regulator, partial [Burkholderiaceae bacterium]|nr:LysR family transcriptional regulator [Burkholderiaceae bacterium]